jgi:hypothetical protein
VFRTDRRRDGTERRRRRAQVDDLVCKIRHYRDGIALQDRYYRLRSQRQCFTGAEAVTWMMDALRLAARTDALDIGQFLMVCCRRSVSLSLSDR